MSLCFFTHTAHAADASPEAEKGVGRHAPSFRGSCGFSEEKARMGRDVPVHPVPCPGRIFRHGREREGERPPCGRKAESALVLRQRRRRALPPGGESQGVRHMYGERDVPAFRQQRVS